MITKRLGMRIQELRKQTGLSQEKFSLQIGMDRTYFASVEAGKRNVSINNIKKSLCSKKTVSVKFQNGLMKTEAFLL